MTILFLKFGALVADCMGTCMLFSGYLLMCRILSNAWLCLSDAMEHLCCIGLCSLQIIKVDL